MLTGASLHPHPDCRGASSETTFKLKAMLYPFHDQSLKPGAFKPGSSLVACTAPPDGVAAAIAADGHAVARALVVEVVVHRVAPALVAVLAGVVLPVQMISRASG